MELTAADGQNGITTADQLSRAGGIGRCELIRGRLVMMSPAGGEHGDLTNEIAWHVTSFVKKHRLGKVYAAETGFVIETDPDTVRATDCAFIATDRVPPRGVRGFYRLAPDLVVETLSPDDRPAAVLDKIGQWLDAGTRMAWVVDPIARTATAYTADGRVEALDTDGTLRGGDVLPGFGLSLRELFAAD